MKLIKVFVGEKHDKTLKQYIYIYIYTIQKHFKINNDEHIVYIYI